MEPVPDSGRASVVVLEPDVEPLGIFPVVAHLSMFAAFGWMLSHVPAFKVVFEDLGTELPVPTLVVMSVNHMFEAVGLPVWMLAIAGAAVDFGVCWILCRKGHLRAANNWMWLVAAGVIPASVALQMILILPFISLINSMK